MLPVQSFAGVNAPSHCMMSRHMPFWLEHDCPTGGVAELEGVAEVLKLVPVGLFEEGARVPELE